MWYVNIALLAIFTHLTLIVLQIYISSRLLILNWESMSLYLINSCSSNQPDFLSILFFWAFLLLLIIFDPLKYLLFCDFGLIYDAGHGGIESISPFIGSTRTVILASDCHRRLAGTSAHLWNILQGLIQMLDVGGTYCSISLMVVSFLAYSTGTRQFFILRYLSNFVNHRVSIFKFRNNRRRLRREQRVIELLGLQTGWQEERRVTQEIGLKSLQILVEVRAWRLMLNRGYRIHYWSKMLF